MIVNRTISGQVIRTVEYMAKHFEGPQGGYPGDSQSSAWYVDCGVQYTAPAVVNIVNVSVSFGLHATTAVYTCANSLTAGAAAVIAGVNSTGTYNANGTFTVFSATPTQFTVSTPGFGVGSFAYLSGGTVSGSAPTGNTNISGIPAVLWNQTVSILGDGGVQPQGVVSATGTLTVAGTFNMVTLGFPYQGNLVPMRPEGGADTGTSQGKIKQGANVVIRLVDAAGGSIGKLSNQNFTTQAYQDPLGLLVQSVQNMEPIAYNYTNTPLDSPPPLQSGDFPVSFPDAASSDQDARDFYILVQQNSPLPMTVVGLYPSYKVEESQ